jgi:antitoxin HicB
MEYAARFEPAEEGGFVVTFPDFAWGITQGDDEAEAIGMAVDALSTMVQELIRNNEPSHLQGNIAAERFVGSVCLRCKLRRPNCIASS